MFFYKYVRLFNQVMTIWHVHPYLSTLCFVCSSTMKFLLFTITIVPCMDTYHVYRPDRLYSEVKHILCGSCSLYMAFSEVTLVLCDFYSLYVLIFIYCYHGALWINSRIIASCMWTRYALY